MRSAPSKEQTVNGLVVLQRESAGSELQRRQRIEFDIRSHGSKSRLCHRDQFHDFVDHLIGLHSLSLRVITQQNPVP
jgi:hypothetical protein